MPFPSRRSTTTERGRGGRPEGFWIRIRNLKCLRPERSESILLLPAAAPAVAREVEPGNFVIVKIDEVAERIALTVADWEELILRRRSYLSEEVRALSEWECRVY